MGKSNAIIGHLLSLLTIIIYSFNTNFMKTLMPVHISAFGLVLARAIFVAIIFWAVGLYWKETAENRPSMRDKMVIMLAGVLGMGANLLFYIKGLELTGPIDTTVIRTLQPIIVIAITAIFFHEKIGTYKVLGIILGIAGTVYISVTPHHRGVQDSFLGDSFIFTSAILAAVYLVIIKPYTAKYHPVTIMKWMSLAALIVTIPFGIKGLINAPMFYHDAGLAVWGKFGFSLLFSSVIGFFLSVVSLKYISAFVKSTYIYILPVTATIVSIALDIQHPSWHDPIAFVIILIGFILVNKSPKKKNVFDSSSEIH